MSITRKMSRKAERMAAKQKATQSSPPSDCRIHSGTGEFIFTHNDGPHLTESNFWDSMMARDGFYRVSINGGALRLHMPDCQHKDLVDIRRGRHAVITLGQHRGLGCPTYELLFDDNTVQPFVLWLSPAQFARAFSFADAASHVRELIVYTWGCVEVARMPVFFRQATTLPCLKPWGQTVG